MIDLYHDLNTRW